MKSDKNFDRTTAETGIPTGSSQGKLQRNPVVSPSTQKLYRERANTDVLLSSTIEFLRLAIRNRANQNSRIMAWDNQRVFGPAPDTSGSAENSDFEAECVLESVPNQVCPNFGDRHLNIYFSDQTDDKLGAWCERCNLKAYYCGETSVLVN